MDKKTGRVFQESRVTEGTRKLTESVSNSIQILSCVCVAECFTTAPCNSSTPSDLDAVC